MSYPRRHTRITYEGLSFLAILAFIVLGSIMRQINLLVLLSGLMIAPFFFNWRISAKMMERLRFQRVFPDTVYAGKPLVIFWEVHNDRRAISSWGIRITDRLRGEAAGRDTEDVVLVIPPVAPGGVAQGSYRCLLPHRGVYRLGPATASSAFPVGLIRTKAKLSEPEYLTVAPALGRLTQSWHRMTRSWFEGEESHQRRRGTADEEIYAIRPWQSGDNKRLVHWRSSAKRNEIHVKQFDQRTDRQFAVTLDLFHVESMEELVEEAVSMLATILNAMPAAQPMEAVGVFGDQQLVKTGRVSRHANGEIMKLLATVGPSSETGIMAGLGEIATHLPASTTVIVISTRSRQ
ncbi:MAG: DUF58 domain-containing protein, partial [Pirellulaceae bacterium]